MIFWWRSWVLLQFCESNNFKNLQKILQSSFRIFSCPYFFGIFATFSNTLPAGFALLSETTPLWSQRQATAPKRESRFWVAEPRDVRWLSTVENDDVVSKLQPIRSCSV
eukprot:Lithocolla_globosa_v1_NODE_4022_length_1527_cov_4.788723.p2 type:complete len:109 gc:universal NODE_4022_length_1527_cov_4.788723:436-110(-)